MDTQPTWSRRLRANQDSAQGSPQLRGQTQAVQRTATCAGRLCCKTPNYDHTPTLASIVPWHTQDTGIAVLDDPLGVGGFGVLKSIRADGSMRAVMDYDRRLFLRSAAQRPRADRPDCADRFKTPNAKRVVCWVASIWRSKRLRRVIFAAARSHKMCRIWGFRDNYPRFCHYARR